MRPNTGLTLRQITEAHCQAILDAYQGLGLRVNQTALDAQHLARTLPEELERFGSVEYRPDIISQNKLDFEAVPKGDHTYLHVQARPLDAPNAKELSDAFDRKMTELFRKD